MSGIDCLAMILAGGRGEELGFLTDQVPKPVVSFGGKYALIDFTLRNCIGSGLTRLGILGHYRAEKLAQHIQTHYADLGDRVAFDLLLPRAQAYVGTAEAVLRNIEYIDRQNPRDVLILPGDHIYRMDYRRLIACHREKGAEVTLAATPVACEGTPRLDIVYRAEGGRVTLLEERAQARPGDLASMGVCVFHWPALRRRLLEDRECPASAHHFRRDILPRMVRASASVYAYVFHGYWRDIQTLDCYWQAHMDMVGRHHVCALLERDDTVFHDDAPMPGGLLEHCGELKNARISGFCFVKGQLEGSVASHCSIGRGARVIDSVIMPYASIGDNVVLYKTIVGTGARVLEHAVIDARHPQTAVPPWPASGKRVTLVTPNATVYP